MFTKNEERNALNKMDLKYTNKEFLERNTKCCGNFNLHVQFTFSDVNVFCDKCLCQLC